MNSKVSHTKYILTYTLALLGIVGGLLFSVRVPHAESSASDYLSGYAWSETIGWISFNCTDTGSCGTSPYGVTVSKTGALSGYAWSEYIGWISFNAADVTGCPSGTCAPSFNSTTGVVTGWAKALAGGTANSGGWDGFISLSGTGPNYGVSATGCAWSGYAWGSTVVGWISFSGSNYGVTGSGAACVQTDPDITPLDFTATVPSTGGTFFDGENIVLVGNMENNGTLPTVSSFDDNFSYRWNGTGAWTNITPYTNHPAGFAVNATGIDNATLNPSGSGNLHIQYCVDSNNSIPEGVFGELGNCMEKSFTVHPKPTGNLTVTTPIPYNTKSTIGWTTNNPDPAACTPRVTGANGDTWSGLSGSEPSSFLTSDTLYSLTCAPYPGILDGKLVDVNTEPFIKANPRRVERGGTAKIDWGTGMEINCSILANGAVVNALVTGLGSRTDTINANTTYTIDCPLIDKSVMVEVQGYGQET